MRLEELNLELEELVSAWEEWQEDTQMRLDNDMSYFEREMGALEDRLALAELAESAA